MEVKAISVGEAKEGRYIVVDGVPCVVKSVQKSKPGKHGHAKCRIEAVSLIDGNKKIFVKPANDSIDSPLVEKEVAQVLSISGNKVNVMDMKTYETFDLDIPEEFKEEIKEGIQVVYWIMMGQRMIKQVRGKDESKE